MKNRESQRAIDLAAELADIEEDIAILEGRRSGDINKDALEEIERSRARLDRREQRLADREFARQRQQALDEMVANLERAGIRQAGQTSFDVYAAQREAEAQNARQRQGFVDEDTRRAIQSAREVLDARERAIRREMELDRLRASKSRIETDLSFENAIIGVGQLTNSVIEGILRIFGTVSGAIAGVAGNTPEMSDSAATRGPSLPSAPGRGGGLPRAQGFFAPRTTGNLVPMAQAVVIEPTNVILDGEVVGRILERRVASRTNRRAAFGIA
jgi:hypothetical protein